MELHVLPFGAPAWELRREILRDIITARPGPPYDFRDVLYVVGNERTVGTLRVLTLETLAETTGAKACIPPEFATLNRLVERAAASSSPKPVVDDVTRMLALEELTKESASKSGGSSIAPDALAPAAAPEIANALERAYVYGVGDGYIKKAAEDSLAARLLLDVKRAYESWLKTHGLADPAAARAASVTDASAFARYRTVVLDGFYDADPTELKLMKALASVPDFRFVVEAPGLSSATASEPGMPYSGTRRLIGELGFSVPELSTGDARADGTAALFSETLFGGLLHSEAEKRAAELSPLPQKITITGATSETEEAWFIARSIKEAYIDKVHTNLDRIMVHFPDADPYIPELERAFTALGIPFTVSAGRPLDESPVTVALMDLLRLPIENWSFGALRRVLANPLVRLSEDGNHPEAFARFGRAERISRGRERWAERLANPKYAPEDGAAIKAPLTRLFEVAATLPSGAARLADWSSATLRLLEDSSIVQSVDALAGERPDLSAALAELVRTIELLAAAAPRLRSKMSCGEYTATLARSLAGLRYKTGDDARIGVRVLGGLETASEPFEVVYVAGLTEASVPARWDPDMFFHGSASESLGLPGRDDARSREARRFLRLLCCAKRVHLVHPLSGSRGPVPQSPYLRAMEPITRAGAIAEPERFIRPIEPSSALSPAELMRSLALSASVNDGWDKDRLLDSLGHLPAGTPGLERAQSALSPRAEKRAPHPPERREFSVTELEDYMVCGFRYYHGRLLKSAPEQDPEDDIAPHAAGSLIHRILGKFYEEAREQVTGSNREESLERLRAIAREEFGSLPDTLENSELVRKFDEEVAPAFIDTEAALSETGYEVRWPEMDMRLECSEEDTGTFVLKGKVDRVELTKDGEFAVADYKTGAYPGHGGGPLKDMFQLPLYAYMIKEGALTETTGKPLRPSRLVYYNLKDPAGGRMRDVVLFDSELAEDDLLKDIPRRKAAPDVIDERLDEAYNKAVGAVSGILNGRFEPDCEKPHICERCEFIAVCEKGIRNAGEEDGGADED